MPSSSKLSNPKDSYQGRFRYLDVIRGFAFLSVFAAHWGGAQWLYSLFQYTFGANEGLHAGVVIFVVLSGFCIHLPQAKRMPNVDWVGNKIFWKQYIIRRLIRIFPVYLFGCILGIISLCWNAEESNIFLRFVAGISFIFAWVPYGAPVGNEVLCIVQVLCWIYLAYPLMCFGRIRGGWKLVFGFSTLLYAVAMSMAYLGIEPTWAGRSIYALLIYWVLGAISAECWCRYGKTISLKGGGLLVGVAFLLYVGFCHYVNIKGSHYLKSLILALWSAGLLFYVASAESRKKSDYNWLTKTMSFVGKISYSLYVVHWPILVVITLLITQYGVGNYFLIGKLLPVILVFIVAYFAYRFIELPSYRLAKKTVV